MVETGEAQWESQRVKLFTSYTTPAVNFAPLASQFPFKLSGMDEIADSMIGLPILRPPGLSWFIHFVFERWIIRIDGIYLLFIMLFTLQLVMQR